MFAKMLQKRNQKGFTLVELIIVVAILAILVGLLAPNIVKYIENSRFGKDQNSLDSVLSAVKAAMADETMAGVYTTTAIGEKAGPITLAELKTADDSLYQLIENDLDPKFFTETSSKSDVLTSSSANGCQIYIIVDENTNVYVYASTNGVAAAANKNKAADKLEVGSFVTASMAYKSGT